jgi:sugar (pentulose or hexulose) kinase
MQRDFPPHGLGRLAWLKERKPQLFNENNIHVGAGEYVYHKLTGVWRQDPGNAIQVGSYNATKNRLDDRALSLIGVPLTFVTPLRRGHETAPLCGRGAKFLGLPEGVRVSGPYIDQEAGYLSAAAASERPLHCSLGTAWVGNFVLPAEVRGGSPFQLVLPDPVGNGRLVVQPLLTGNTSWDWGLRTFAGARHSSALERAAAVFAESLTPPPGLVALPFLTQRNPLDAAAYGCGTFFGVGAETERADMLRALAAGMTFELARVLADVKRAGVVDSVVVGGGASKGEHFRALIAALFDPLPVLLQTDEDLSAARGALFALSRKAARTGTKRIGRPGKKRRSLIQAAFDAYLSVFEKICGSVPEAAPVKITSNRR